MKWTIKRLGGSHTSCREVPNRPHKEGVSCPCWWEIPWGWSCLSKTYWPVQVDCKGWDENNSEIIIDWVGVERNEQFAGGADHFQLVAVLPWNWHQPSVLQTCHGENSSNQVEPIVMSKTFPFLTILWCDFRLHLTMLGFPIVRDSLYNERDSKPRLSLGDFEHHPLLVEALDKMENELEKDKLPDWPCTSLVL